MTGRGAGYCGGFGTRGRGIGGGGRPQGRSGGRGWRHWFYATGLPGWMRFGGYGPASLKLDPEMEKQALENEAAALQSELDSIKKRLEEIESKTAGQ